MLIGLIVRDIIDPLDAAAIKAASIEGSRHGYNIVLGHVLETAEAETQLSHILEARICDAIILLGELAHLTELSEGLQDADLPVAAVWQRTPVLGDPNSQRRQSRRYRLGAPPPHGPQPRAHRLRG